MRGPPERRLASADTGPIIVCRLRDATVVPTPLILDSWARHGTSPVSTRGLLDGCGLIVKPRALAAQALELGLLGTREHPRHTKE